MWLLISFIIIWAISPGPVVVMTIHEARKNGFLAGLAVSGGASVTSLAMVVMGLIVHYAGFSTLIEQDGMLFFEKAGAFGVIGMGLYSGYKSLAVNKTNAAAAPDLGAKMRFGFGQGLLVMATYIPQALVYYNVIIPKTISTPQITSTIILLGALKVALIFGWHAMVAWMATRKQKFTIIKNKRHGKVFEALTSVLIIGLGINILI
jgi:threonine/homoserine/homoserine lactone efflux protein